ncbi:VOC family protein [Micromonospora sp. WMMD1102]|uniref:VOC family protein n=1 Tax=Micromonospora sp. WMMD1102 TaxID=3016105 RepID=UPI002414DA78|nr:VOC family protein [Micromonospora sp. WMMD1102]MDG4786868.1 VOC family protein [Micromonospora sp. WMMD1102]
MIGTLRTVVLDARDLVGLARFYQELAGWTQIHAEDDWITMATGDGWRVAVQPAPDHVAPRWPDPGHPQQAHLDLRVPDLELATARAQELGATLLRRNERWHTLADPAGHPFDLCLNPDDPRTTLMGVMLDCPDAKALSLFYAELLGKPVTYEGDGMAMIGDDGAQPLLFQQVADYSPPRWPDPAHPQQFHLDVRVDDVAAAEPAALALGATRLPGEGDNWRVYADPAGKPFCFVWDFDQG